MERIPVEVLEMIFDRVPVGQLDNCRLVCKLWQWIIDRLAFDCLVVYLDCPPVNQTLFPRNRRLSLRYCVHMHYLVKELKKKRKKSIYLKFKKMYFYDHVKAFCFQKRCSLGDWQEIYLRNVQMVTNQLSQLEELHLCDVTDRERNSKLFLPNLKIFKIILRVNGIAPLFHGLTLDAPQLKHLRIRYYGKFRLVHPETVETLEILPDNWRSLFDNNFLTSFTGLKRLLFFGEIGPWSDLLWRDGMMKFLSGLEEIHVLSTDFCKKFYEGMQELKERDNHLRIYISGFEIDALRDLLSTITMDTRYKYLCSRILETSDQRNFYQANYAALSETPQIHGVDYNLIEPLIGAHLFTPQRLPMLKLVIVNRPVRDEHTFGWWLSQLNSLIEISFLCSLSQEFYSNILPASCPTLPCLTLDFGTPLDFSFLFKLKFLFRLDLTGSDYGLIKPLFANLAYLRCLAFEEHKYNPDRQSLGVTKRRNKKKKKMVFEVYNGQEREKWNKNHNLVFKFVQEFETFESLGEFLDEFTGF